MLPLPGISITARGVVIGLPVLGWGKRSSSSARIEAGLYRILHMDFREVFFHALG
jgi:hypothetical protein